MLFMCALTTGKALVGTRPRSGRRRGGFTAAGVTKEVTFEPIDGLINDRTEDAYRAKYRGSPYIGSMISAGARAATVKIMPRESNTDTL